MTTEGTAVETTTVLKRRTTSLEGHATARMEALPTMETLKGRPRLVIEVRGGSGERRMMKTLAWTGMVERTTRAKMML